MSTKEFLELLERNRMHLTRQQFKTLRGQALKGDIPGALRGIRTVMER